MKKGAKIEEIRKGLLNVEGVRAVVITDTKGKLLGSGAPSFAQASAELIEMAEVTAEDIHTKKPDEIILASKFARIIVMKAGPDALVAVRAKPEANQQLISLEMLRAATEIKKLMKKRRRENGTKIQKSA